MHQENGEDKPVFATGFKPRESSLGGGFGNWQTERLSNLATISDARLTDLKIQETIDRLSNLSQSAYFLGNQAALRNASGAAQSGNGGGGFQNPSSNNHGFQANSSASHGYQSPANSNNHGYQPTNPSSSNNDNNFGNLSASTDDLFARLSSLSASNQGGGSFLNSRNSFSTLGNSFSTGLPFSTGKQSNNSNNNDNSNSNSFSTGMKAPSQLSSSPSSNNLGGMGNSQSSVGNVSSGDALSRLTDMNLLGRLSNLSQGIGRFTGLTSDLNLNRFTFSRLSGFPTDLGLPTNSNPSANSLSSSATLGTSSGPHDGFNVGKQQETNDDTPSNRGRKTNNRSRPPQVETQFENARPNGKPNSKRSPATKKHSSEEVDVVSPASRTPTSAKGTYDTSGPQPPKFIVGLSSLDLFMSFTHEYPNPTNPSEMIVDTKDILSRKCYEAWIRTRRASLKKPEESFRRALTAHVTGADRRRPFPPAVEKSLLAELRKQQTWACFEGQVSSEGKEVKIGEQGFRTMGYHEKKAYEAQESDATGVNVSSGRYLAGNSFLHGQQGEDPWKRNNQLQLSSPTFAGAAQSFSSARHGQDDQRQPQMDDNNNNNNNNNNTRPSLVRRLSDTFISLLPPNMLDGLRHSNNPGQFHGAKRKREDGATIPDDAISPSKRALQSQYA